MKVLIKGKSMDIAPELMSTINSFGAYSFKKGFRIGFCVGFLSALTGSVLFWFFI